MNAHSPGPITNHSQLIHAYGGATVAIAKPIGNGVGRHNQSHRNAALLAAAYTAFDQAGRALGVDATTLASSIDLEAVIRMAIARCGWESAVKCEMTFGAVWPQLIPADSDHRRWLK